MKNIIYLICYSLFLSTYLHAQNDTVNSGYFRDLQIMLKSDSNVKDIRYICEFYKNGKVKEQHVYVKYKNDSIDRYWRIGNCFHYYKSGSLKAKTIVDLKTRAHNDLDISFAENGDTTWITKYENDKSRFTSYNTIFSQVGLGKIYEITTDKYIDIFFKKGKRKEFKTYILCSNDAWFKINEGYYSKDNTIESFNDYSEQFKQIEQDIILKKKK